MLLTEKQPYEFIHKGYLLRYAGLHKCVFTGHPMLWFIKNNEYFFFDLAKEKSLFINGTIRKTDFIKSVLASLKEYSFNAVIYDNINSDVALAGKIIAADTDQRFKLLNGLPKTHLTIYECSSEMIVSYEHRNNTFILKN